MSYARGGFAALLKAHLPGALRATGLSLLGASAAVYFLVRALGVESPPMLDFLAHVGLTAPFCGVLLYGGYWLARSDLPTGRFPRIGSWFVGGLVGFLLLNVVMIALWSSGSLWGDFGWGVFAANVGGAGGLVIGVFEARMVERELVAERSRVRREEAERRSDRLDDFARIVSHDLRNPLNVATGNLEFLREECESTQLDAAAAALDRMEDIVAETLTLARSGQVIGDTEPVGLFDVVESCWASVATDGAELRIEGSAAFAAAPDRVRHLFENLFRNAVEHCGDDVTVRVGSLDGGFYVADDGPGIPTEERDRVFDAGYSTAADGTGFGLAIVEQVADAHGWTVELDVGDDGARFEFRGVERVDPERELPA